MNSLAEYFHTDWAAMTPTDWFGTLLTVAVSLALAIAYFQVFRPKNRDRLEARKYLPFAEDDDPNGGGHG